MGMEEGRGMGREIGIRRIIGRGMLETPRRILGIERRTLDSTVSGARNDQLDSVPTLGGRASLRASISSMTTVDRPMRSRPLLNRSTPAMTTGRRMRSLLLRIRNMGRMTATGWHMPNRLLLNPDMLDQHRQCQSMFNQHLHHPSILDLLLHHPSTIGLRLQCPSMLSQHLRHPSTPGLLLPIQSTLDQHRRCQNMLNQHLHHQSTPDLLLPSPSTLDLPRQRHSPHMPSPSNGSTPNRTRTSNTLGIR